MSEMTAAEILSVMRSRKACLKSATWWNDAVGIIERALAAAEADHKAMETMRAMKRSVLLAGSHSNANIDGKPLWGCILDGSDGLFYDDPVKAILAAAEAAERSGK